MEVDYIIVQAGGKGTRMGKLTRNKPKALIPVQNLPILFHLFRKYPQKTYLIIGDYQCNVLKRYLAAFASVDYRVIDAGGRQGTCAGLKEALSYVPEGRAFMLTWCDLILPSGYKLPEEEADYVGISKDFTCRWRYEQGIFREEPSAESGVAGHFIFRDRSLLAQVPDEGEFVKWLGEADIFFRELPLYQTKEYGLLSEYEKLGADKCRPFNRLTVDGDTLVKEGIDAQGEALAVRERAWYEKVRGSGFEEIPRIDSLKPLRMEMIHGKNIYEYTDLPFEKKKEILSRIVGCLKAVHQLGSVQADRASYDEAYIGKTFQRLEKVRDLVPFANDRTVMVNQRKCRNVFYVREALEQAVAQYFPGEFQFLHGDCTFSNILLRENRTPVLIDPRGYFGTTELYGDPAYDWAKLYYSIVGNYDQFNLKRFDLAIGEDGVSLQIATNHWEDMEQEFFELLQGSVEFRQLRLLHAIIWLSLTTYAWEDYDSVCGAFYNGLYYLEEAL